MATNLHDFVHEKAEIISNRLKDVLSSGQGYIHSQFGVDLGLNPELYPTWVILSTAVVGLLVVLVLSWVAIRGGFLVGKKRGSSGTNVVVEPLKANFNTIAKQDEQRRKNKKSAEKKAQSNGRQFSVPQEDNISSETVSKPPPEIISEKGEQTPVQGKKNKKKAKAEVKPAHNVTTTTTILKEPDEGAWQTKVSNREKRQQRRKDKGPEEFGSPGGTKAPKSQVETPVTSTNGQKNRVPSGWKGDPPNNGGGRAEAVPMSVDGDKRSATGFRHRAQPEAMPWRQDKQAAWSGVEGRKNTDVKPALFSSFGLNDTEHTAHPIDLQWDCHPDVNDEWSGLNGMLTGDPGSDWNAPVEHWGNYEECSMPVKQAPPLKEQLGPHKVSEGENATEDTVGVSKSKKRRKKKKNADEDASSVAQVASSGLSDGMTMIVKHQEFPSLTTSHSPRVLDKKSEQTSEPQKQGQKKGLRREIQKSLH